MRSYPKVHHIGDPMLQGILDDSVIVEEKVDGSQFRIHIDINGNIHFGSHRVEFPTLENNGMFQVAVDECSKRLAPLLKPRKHDLYIFAEFIGKNKQNTLTYDRIPDSKIVVYDVIANSRWYDYDEKNIFALNFGFDAIPLLTYVEGKYLTADKINKLLETESYLGGTKIEGIVVKNYNKFFDPSKYNWMEGNFLVGKYVRQEFQELNKKEHAGEMINMNKIKLRYIAEARWDKAIQKMREEDKLENNMKDLAVIIPEVKRDVEEECKEDIKEQLYKLYGRQIISGSIRGLPEYYNKKLIKDLGEDK